MVIFILLTENSESFYKLLIDNILEKKVKNHVAKRIVYTMVTIVLII